MQSSLTPLALALALGAAFSVSAQDQTGSLFSPYLEWKLDHANHSGNPFDVEGKAVFTHAVSGETRTTGMFYNGGNTWRFRFTATRTGKWTFQRVTPRPRLMAKRAVLSSTAQFEERRLAASSPVPMATAARPDDELRL